MAVVMGQRSLGKFGIFHITSCRTQLLAELGRISSGFLTALGQWCDLCVSHRHVVLHDLRAIPVAMYVGKWVFQLVSSFCMDLGTHLVTGGGDFPPSGRNLLGVCLGGSFGWMG